MRLYTICVDAIPAVVLSAGADLAMEDSFLRDPEMMKALRAKLETERLIDQAYRARGILAAEVQRVEDDMEIDDALNTWLGEDLCAKQHEGRPLWDGNRDRLRIREAETDEADHWRSSLRNAIDSGEEDAGSEGWLIFLV